MGTTWLIRQKDSILRLDTSTVAIYTSHFLLYPSCHFYLKKTPKLVKTKNKWFFTLHTSKLLLCVCVYVCFNIWTHIGKHPRENFSRLEKTILINDLLLEFSSVHNCFVEVIHCSCAKMSQFQGLGLGMLITLELKKRTNTKVTDGKQLGLSIHCWWDYKMV